MTVSSNSIVLSHVDVWWSLLDHGHGIVSQTDSHLKL